MEETYNIADILRNYADLPGTNVMFKCVLGEAAATIDSLKAERDNLLMEVHILHEELKRDR